MMKPLCSHLLGAGYWSRFLSLLSFIFASHVCYSVSCSGKSPLQVCNFTLRRFKVFLLHFAAITAAVYYLLFSLCLLLRFVLNCVAKVQRYLQPTKHFAKNLCIFNLLQQIRLFLPKFIHILSTKSTKCAICKANLFAFRLITYVHYIITNNNAIFV